MVHGTLQRDRQRLTSGGRHILKILQPEMQVCRHGAPRGGRTVAQCRASFQEGVLSHGSERRLAFWWVCICAKTWFYLGLLFLKLKYTSHIIWAYTVHRCSNIYSEISLPCTAHSNTHSVHISCLIKGGEQSMEFSHRPPVTMKTGTYSKFRKNLGAQIVKS